MTARSERPIRREISWVRPPMRPLTDSREFRVFVARGSIAYSAVTQPRPLPLRQRGTPSVSDAAHSTRVPPNSTSTEPSAWSSHPREIVTGHSWSAVRPSERGAGVEESAMEPSLPTAEDPALGADLGTEETPAELDERRRVARRGEHVVGLGERG